MTVLDSCCSYPRIINRYMKYVTYFALVYVYCSSPMLVLWANFDEEGGEGGRWIELSQIFSNN